ncbi:MAG: SDR family NAD(P)-dependent oxidoreductase [Phycicoccus sp.]
MSTTGTKTRALLVGGTAGIGAAIARQLAGEGVEVTVVGRNAAAGRALAVETSGSFVQGDVSTVGGALSVARRYAEQHDRLHLLVQSADVLTRGRHDSGDGIELSFATNFVSRFVIARELTPLLRAGAHEPGGSGVLHVAAAGGPGPRLDPAAVPPGPKVGAFRAHGAGQGANDVLGIELATRLAPDGIRVHVVNPGMVHTTIRDEAMSGPAGRILSALLGPVLSRRGRTPEQSARDILTAVRRHPEDPLLGAKGEVLTIRAHLRDPAYRADIWHRTEDLVDRASG